MPYLNGLFSAVCVPDPHSLLPGFSLCPQELNQDFKLPTNSMHITGSFLQQVQGFDEDEDEDDDQGTAAGGSGSERRTLNWLPSVCNNNSESRMVCACRGLLGFVSP